MIIACTSQRRRETAWAVACVASLREAVFVVSIEAAHFSLYLLSPERSDLQLDKECVVSILWDAFNTAFDTTHSFLQPRARIDLV